MMESPSIYILAYRSKTGIAFRFRMFAHINRWTVVFHWLSLCTVIPWVLQANTLKCAIDYCYRVKINDSNAKVVRRQIIGNHYGMALVLLMLKYSFMLVQIIAAAQYCCNTTFIFGLFHQAQVFLALKCGTSCAGYSFWNANRTPRFVWVVVYAEWPGPPVIDDSLPNEISIKKFNYHSNICVIYLLIMNIEQYVANLEHLSRVIRYAKYHHIHQLIGSMLVFSGCMNIYAACNILYCIRCEHLVLAKSTSVYCIIPFSVVQQVQYILHWFKWVNERTNKQTNRNESKYMEQTNEVGKYHKKTVKMMKWNCNIGVLYSFNFQMKWNEMRWLGFAYGKSIVHTYICSDFYTRQCKTGINFTNDFGFGE